MSSTDLFDTQKLLAEGSWLNTLACQLADDPAVADDAAQRTVLAGIERQRRGEATGRGWLTAVLRNFVRQDRRAFRDRRKHEEAAARDAATESTLDVAARLELQRTVLEAVQQLDEPYRSTIALRFFGGLPPRKVAKRLGVPVKTVHTRLERGLAKLRGRLDRSYGGRGTWLSIVAPWSWTTNPVVLALPGLGVMLAMSTSMKWAASILAVVSVGWLWQNAQAELPTSEIEIAAAGDSERTAEPAASDMPEAVKRSEVVVEPGGDEAEDSLLPAEPVPTFSGIVVGIDDRGIADVPVHFDKIDDPTPDQTATRSNSGGHFEMPLPQGRGRLVGRGNGFAPLISPGIKSEPPAEPPRVVVGPDRTYAGVVWDENGDRVAGVTLVLTLREADLRRLQPGGLYGAVPVARGESGDDGTFAFEHVGYAPGMRLRASRDGYEPCVVELPSTSDEMMAVKLSPLALSDSTLAGRVVDRHGEPVADAYVGAGNSTTRSGADGRFVLEPSDHDGRVLRAVAPGALPAAVDLLTVAKSDRHRIELRLGAASRAITGRVVDERGAPVEGAKVWTFDGVKLGRVPSQVGDMTVIMSLDIEDVVDGKGRSARAAVDGAFELRGLVERVGGYDLFAMHPVTQSIARATAVEAGVDGIQLTLGREHCATVAGIVVDSSGNPLEGALLRVNRVIRDPLGKRVGMASAERSFFAETGSDGRFRFDELAIQGTSLLLNGEIVASAQTIELSKVADLENIRFVAPQTAHLRVLLQSDTELANTFELLDEQGKRINLSFMQGGVTLGSDAVGIADGASPLVRANDSARTIVLYGRNGEVLRQPVRLSPDQVTELRF